MTIGLGALSVSFRGSYAAGPTFDYIVTNDGDASTEGSLAWAIALGSATLSGKRIGIMPGTYTNPDFNGLAPSSTTEFIGMSSGVRLERAVLRFFTKLSFSGIKFTTAEWSVTQGACIRLGGTIGDLTIRNCQFRGNWRGDVDFDFDPTDASSATVTDSAGQTFFNDNRYYEFAMVFPIVDGATGAILDLVASRKNTDLADGTYDVSFDGSVGGMSGSGASAKFDVVDGVIGTPYDLVPGSGYARGGVGRLPSWPGQINAGDHFKYGIQAFNPGGDGQEPEVSGTLVIEDSTFSLLGEGVKIGGFNTSTARYQVRRNLFDLIYQDSASFGAGVTPAANWDFSFNVRTRPIFSPGDAGDPHGDLFQIFFDDIGGEVTEGLVRVDSVGNLSLVGNSRGQNQGYVFTDTPSGDPNTALTAGELGLGITGNLFLLRGHGNALSASSSRWLPVYGNTFVAWDTNEVGNLIVISSDENVYPGTIVGANIAEGYVGSSDPDTDFATWPNVTVDRDGTPLPYATVFTDPDSLPETAAEAVAAYAPLLAYAGKGAVGLVDFVAQTIDLSQMPVMTWFPPVFDVDVSTLTTSTASRILGGAETITVTPGPGTEWRVADNEAMDENVTSWSSSIATGSYRGKFLQLRETSSASGSTTITASVMLNSTPATFEITTESVAVFPIASNGGTAYSQMAAPTLESGLTQFIFAMRYRGPASPTANARVLAAATAAQMQFWNPSSTTQRFNVGSSVWAYRAAYVPDDQWHTHIIQGDTTPGRDDLAAQQWWIDGTLITKADGSDFTPGSSFTTANIFAGSGGLGIFGEGDGGNVLNGGEFAFLWFHWAPSGLVFPDFSDPANRNRFTADNIGADGSGAFGYQPKIYRTGDATALNAGAPNLGSLVGTFNKPAGTWTDV